MEHQKPFFPQMIVPGNHFETAFWDSEATLSFSVPAVTISPWGKRVFPLNEGGKSHEVTGSGGGTAVGISNSDLAAFVLSSFCVFMTDTRKNHPSRCRFWGDQAGITPCRGDHGGARPQRLGLLVRRWSPCLKLWDVGFVRSDGFHLELDPLTYSLRRHQKKPKCVFERNHDHPAHHQSFTRLWSGTYP